MRYGSVCSGIEAASVAWEPLGWQAAFYSEIEPFPCHVLHEHFSSGRPAFMPDPDALGLKAKDRKARAAAIKAVSRLPERANGVPNHGDMTQFEEWPDHAIDLLVGGTPCQSYSVAGLRKGLDDPRGDLMLTYAAIARRYRPRWLVWENVFGVLSSKGGRDFASLLGLLSGRRVEVPAGGWKSAGIVEGYGGAYGLAWRVFDTQYVRVDGAPRALPQRRRRVFVVGHTGGDWRRAAAVLFEREGLSGDPAPRREPGKGFAADVVSSLTASGRGVERPGETRGQDPVVAVRAAEVAPTLNAAFGEKLGLENQHIDGGAGMFVAHSLRAEGFDASEDGTGRHSNAGGQVAVAFAENSRAELRLCGGDGQVMSQLTTGGGKPGQGQPCIATQWAVRRLTPTECARLQGFPDNHCRIPWRGKPAEQCPDGPQYKAYGNSMSTNVMRWLGERIEAVEQIASEQFTEAAE